MDATLTALRYSHWGVDIFRSLSSPGWDQSIVDFLCRSHNFSIAIRGKSLESFSVLLISENLFIYYEMLQY